MLMDLATYAKIKKQWFDCPSFVFVFIYQVITPFLQILKNNEKQWTNNYHLNQCGGVSGHVECVVGATEGFVFSFLSLKIK